MSSEILLGSNLRHERIEWEILILFGSRYVLFISCIHNLLPVLGKPLVQPTPSLTH